MQYFRLLLSPWSLIRVTYCGIYDLELSLSIKVNLCTYSSCPLFHQSTIFHTALACSVENLFECKSATSASLVSTAEFPLRFTKVIRYFIEALELQHIFKDLLAAPSFSKYFAAWASHDSPMTSFRNSFKIVSANIVYPTNHFRPSPVLDLTNALKTFITTQNIIWFPKSSL